jgi:hypothetical protein
MRTVIIIKAEFGKAYRCWMLLAVHPLNFITSNSTQPQHVRIGHTRYTIYGMLQIYQHNQGKRKREKNLELEMSSSHMSHKNTAVTVVPVHVIKAYKGSESTAPQILNICTKCR